MKMRESEQEILALVERYRKLILLEKQIEKEKRATSERIVEEMRQDREKIGNFMVVRRQAISYPELSFEEAEKLGAVKMVKDVRKIRELAEAGKIKGEAKIANYVVIKEIN